MPHVKGNKFKPKLPTPPPEPEPEPAVPQQQQVQQPGGGGKKQRKKRKAGAAAAAGGGDAGAVEAAAPAAAAPPQGKKRKQQAQQPALPAIPTVVSPAPKPGVAPAAAAAAATSNWAALKAAMAATKQQQEDARPAWQKRRRAEAETAAAAASGAAAAAAPANRPGSMGTDVAPTKVVAIDCEMVGVGPNGQRSVLARVCVVNSAGNVLLDSFVRPNERVTDFRTRVSGVRPADLRGTPPFDQVQRQVSDLLKGRIVVGHAIENDLEVLLLSHKRKDVRDTSKYPPLMKPLARSGKLKPRALRHLAEEQLGLTIQDGEHSPLDDARAALYLYMKHRKDWERWVAAGSRQHQHPAAAAAAAAAALGGKLGPGAAGGVSKRAALSLEELAQRGSHLADL